MEKKRKKRRKSSVRLPIGRRTGGLIKPKKGGRYYRYLERKRLRIKGEKEAQK